MVKGRIRRARLDVPERSEVYDIAPHGGSELRLEDGVTLDASWFRGVPQADQLLSELSIHVRGHRSAKSQVKVVLRYLRFVAEAGGVVSGNSLREYKEQIDRDAGKSASTKSQIFGAAKAYVRSAMASGLLVHEELPANFKVTLKNAKQNFVDVCRSGISTLVEPWLDEIDALKRDRGMGGDEAEALVFASKCMGAIRAYSLAASRQTMNDWNLVWSVVSGLRESDLEELRETDLFYRSPNKSLKLAIRVLYAHYGYVLPQSQAWPRAVVDWCKQRKVGWIPSRMRGAFFPAVKSLDAFLGLMLTDSDLMPNVDSAAFYSYLDSCQTSPNDNLVDVYLGKYRGAPVEKAVRSDSETVVAIQALAVKVRETLPYMPGGTEFLSESRVPLMLHYTASAGRRLRVKKLDPCTTSDMVRRLLRVAATEYPELKSLVGKVTGENFRPTHVLVKVLSGQHQHQISRDLNHSHFSTTVRYIDRVETQAMLYRKHQNFQKYLVSEAAKVRRTGSGYVCGAPEDSTCNRYNSCFACEAKRIVLSSPAIAAEWLAWEEHISTQKGLLESNNPERWIQYWQPKLAEYQAMISMASEQMLRQARLLVPGVELPCLD